MAYIRVTYTFADGDEVECECHVDESFPDAVAQARAEAMRGFREAFGYCIETLTKDTD
jgi:hypothetical protein